MNITRDLYIDESKVNKSKLIDEGGYDFAFGVDYIEDENYCFNDMHYELEIGIVLSGNITRIYQNTKMDLEPGDIWLSNIWEPHGLKINKAPTEIALFVISPESLANIEIPSCSDLDLLAPFFSIPEKRPVMQTKEDKNFVIDIANRAKKAIKRGSKNNFILVKLLALELLIQIQENWEPEIIKTNQNYDDYLKINPALNLVFNNKELLPVKTAAAECGLSEKSFSRKFKKIFGYTFSQYSLNYRVKSSANELVKTNLPIKELVYKWGFTDESHYNKLFQKYYNCSPGEYRNSHINK